MSASRIDKTELLSKTIQTYLNNDCALLIGSGNSIPYGLPSMLELADEIKSKLNFKYKSNIKWQRFVEELNKTNNLELSLDTVEIDDYIHRDIIWVVWELIHLKDRTALNNILLNSIPPALTNILNKFVQKTDPTNIITTNYDRLIEYSCDMVNGKLNDGFSGEFIRRFSKFQSKPNKRVINHLKFMDL
ncbi:MAG: hypothetical protein U5K00_21285 [Melioribacteraceae bacterium]|nr:hypothetical protein [Melioribacteraceae bacterium]